MSSTAGPTVTSPGSIPRTSLPDSALPLHASAFAYCGAGCLVIGASGSGKSTLLAEALLRGATLIADDRVGLTSEQGELLASPVEKLRGVLELRGLGLVRVEPVAARHPIHLAVTLDTAAHERLPELGAFTYEAITLPHLQLPPAPQTPVAGLLIYLKAMQNGRILGAEWHPAE